MAIVFGPTKWQNDYFISYPIQIASLGDAVAGGYLICRNGGVAWIVAPASTEVTRTWYCRDDAVTTAGANAACGDWFVPTCGQLLNPGYSCITYWDSYSSNRCYWSSSEGGTSSAYRVNLTTGATSGYGKVADLCIRAFRCVSY